MRPKRPETNNTFVFISILRYIAHHIHTDSYAATLSSILRHLFVQETQLQRKLQEYYDPSKRFRKGFEKILKDRLAIVQGHIKEMERKIQDIVDHAKMQTNIAPLVNVLKYSSNDEQFRAAEK